MRTYKKKNPGVNADNVKEALKAVENKIMSQRAACKAFNVTRKTLYRRLKEKHHLPNYPAGMKSSLPFDSEVELAVALTTLAKQGFALTRTEVRQLVKEYVEKHKEDNNQIGEHLCKYCQFKNNCPGNDWMTKFLKKFKLSSKKPSSLEKSRLIASQDPEIIFGFYDNLEKQMLTLGIINKPKNIYNLDETNMCIDPQNTKVIAPSGKKVTRCTSTSGRENVSVLATVNAAGERLPPLVIFPAKSLWTSFKGTPNLEYPGTMYAKSNNGWMTAEVFTEWFNKFCLQVKERPLLIIYDGHSSHVCYNIIAKAREENITILKLPPHTTDCLQPLDVACFKTFHSVWDAKLIDYHRRIGTRHLTKVEVVDLLGQVWEKGINTNNIISGFEKTGIYPVNRHRYPSEKFNKYLMAKYNHSILLGSGNVHLMVNPPSLNEAPVMEIQLPSSHETSTRETSIPEVVALDQAPSTSSSVPALGLIDQTPSVPALIDQTPSVPALIDQAPINTSTDESPYKSSSGLTRFEYIINKKFFKPVDSSPAINP
ncbi:unnamed protein product [Rotaria magnacalcarata]|uniref:DDE-1 domain-containing protein n=1 Tax=Rotaria magnacalcarata TaxID=392030 RepID=A0A819YRD2_9BILA|nr:unnamed protein product [Rotaria magnacalcarata]CAF4164242.1 unnamed protein product [Rotaria magnacalcarata]